MNKRIAATSAAIVMAGGIAAGVSASSASANNYPTPTPSPTVTVTPTINPFANCRFTFSRVSTFAPQIGQFRVRFIPAIVCVGPFGNVRVYDLVR